MFFQDCKKFGSCNEICDRLKKHFKHSYVLQRELTIGREVEYDNSSFWPDDLEDINPDILAMQVKGIGNVNLKN